MKKRAARVVAVVVMTLVMLGTMWSPGVLKTASDSAVGINAVECAYAASSISKSKAKKIATRNAKSRYKVKKAYNLLAKKSTYRGKSVYKVTFFAKKSGTKFNYLYYISDVNGQIFYRKQYSK